MVATLAAIALAGLLVQPVTQLRMVTPGGAMLVCQRIPDGTTVTLAFTHSVYGGEVREIWKADGSQLLRIGFETDNAAAAEYYAYKGRVTRTATGFDIPVPHLDVDALPIRVDQVGRHRLRFGGDELSLADQVDGSVAATMSVEQDSLLEWMFGGGCG